MFSDRTSWWTYSIAYFIWDKNTFWRMHEKSNWIDLKIRQQKQRKISKNAQSIWNKSKQYYDSKIHLEIRLIVIFHQEHGHTMQTEQNLFLEFTHLDFTYSKLNEWMFVVCCLLFMDLIKHFLMHRISFVTLIKVLVVMAMVSQTKSGPTQDFFSF